MTDIRFNQYGTNGATPTAVSATGGDGGAGYTIGGGAADDNYALIAGGTGGLGGPSYVQPSQFVDQPPYKLFPGGSGGAGGAGVDLNSGQLSNESGGSIQGGSGGNGTATPGDGYPGGYGGVGGVGVDVSAGKLFNETGASITGGNGGNGASGGNSYGGGGDGGAGVTLSGKTTLTNFGGATISGGNGGLKGINNVGGVSYDGVGGNGVSVHNGTLTNFGTIIGGSAGHGSNSNSNGGAGVYLNGGTVETSGTITGGQGGTGGYSGGYPGDAVQFGSLSGRLIVDPGAVFNGQVDANASANGILQLSGTESGGTGITLGTQFTGFHTLTFASGAQWTVDLGAGAATAHPLNINGFASGDTVDITNQNPGQVAGDFGVTPTLLGGGVDDFKGSLSPQFSSTADGTATFIGNFAGEYFILTPDGHGGTDVTVSDAPCFRRGTRILSERGELEVETLKIGDRVATLSGISQPILWIGRRSYTSVAAAGNRHLLPVRIRAGALGAGLPTRDLWVSPEHAMYIDGMLIPALALINGVSIIQEDEVEELTYFHLEFDSHEIVFSEGATSESFVDDYSREMFDNAGEFRQLYPHKQSEPAGFCAPRVEEGWELEAVRQRLAKRAAGIEAEEVYRQVAARPPREERGGAALGR